MGMKKQDINIVPLGDRIGGTTAAVYNNMYKHFTMTDLKNRVRAIYNLRNNCGLKLSGRDLIVFKPIRGRTLGIQFGNTGRIFIDPRRSTLEIISTVAHELVHEEQTYLGKLDTQYINSQWYYVWDGKTYNQKAKTYQDYLNFPWEIEARERQFELACRALSDYK